VIPEPITAIFILYPSVDDTYDVYHRYHQLYYKEAGLAP
jgi:hypothetical protein